MEAFPCAPGPRIEVRLLSWAVPPHQLPWNARLGIAAIYGIVGVCKGLKHIHGIYFRALLDPKIPDK